MPTSIASRYEKHTQKAWDCMGQKKRDPQKTAPLVPSLVSKKINGASFFSRHLVPSVCARNGGPSFLRLFPSTKILWLFLVHSAFVWGLLSVASFFSLLAGAFGTKTHEDKKRRMANQKEKKGKNNKHIGRALLLCVCFFSKCIAYSRPCGLDASPGWLARCPRVRRRTGNRHRAHKKKERDARSALESAQNDAGAPDAFLDAAVMQAHEKRAACLRVHGEFFAKAAGNKKNTTDVARGATPTKRRGKRKKTADQRRGGKRESQKAMRGKTKGATTGGAARTNGQRQNAPGRPRGAQSHNGVPRTYLVPIRKRVATPAAVLASLGVYGGADVRGGGGGHGEQEESEHCGGDSDATTTVVTFVRLTKAQMARGRQRAWEERCAQRRARSQQPVPASQTCGQCNATVYGAVDACPSCGVALVHIVAAVAVEQDVDR